VGKLLVDGGVGLWFDGRVVLRVLVVLGDRSDASKNVKAELTRRKKGIHIIDKLPINWRKKNW
jgi:hypothetical protein